ncbi:HNH endonuclease signature motif containing protein [Luteipulveratus mongoliensis]|nr:HNH endonuclease signature motif containing protein [Luteipulveratus mongoliensis]
MPASSHLPAHVSTWLRTIALGGGDHSPVDDPEAVRSRAAEVVAASRCLQAWAESVEVKAVSLLLEGVETDMSLDLGQQESRSTRRTRLGLARTAAATELQLLSGLPLTQCRERIGFAGAVGDRTEGLQRRMAEGELSWWRASILFKETRHLPSPVASKVIDRVLRPVAGDDRTPLSHQTFRRRLSRQITLAESASEVAARRRKEAVDQRDVRTSPGAHGVAQLEITASAERTYAAQQRVTALARTARAAGDPRTLAQLRSDIATDLLVHGQVAGDAVLGKAPQAHVHVIAHLASLMATNHGAVSVRPPKPSSGRVVAVSPAIGQGIGEVPGHGFLTADQVRELAFAEGSIWRRLVTDPLTGAVIDAASTYRPTAAMRQHVQARDQRCRAPGCEHPAMECDIDHNVSWRPDTESPGQGATHVTNLRALHRAHHIAKTRRWWTSQQHDDGAVTWSTLSGQQITTRPADHHEVADLEAIECSRMEAALDALLEHDQDIPPVTPVMAAILQRRHASPEARQSLSAPTMFEPRPLIVEVTHEPGPPDPPPF